MPRSMCRALRAWRSSIVAATPFLVPLLVPNVAPVFAADVGGLAGPGLSAGPGRVPTAPDAGGRVDLLLDVVVNGQPIGQIGEFQARNGRLFVSRHELRSLGFRVPLPDRQGGSEADVLALDELAGLTSRLDQKTQTLNVTASIEALATTILGGSQENASLLPVESGFRRGHRLRCRWHRNEGPGACRGADRWKAVYAMGRRGLLLHGHDWAARR